jgi:uncharacterized membrane protein
LGGLGVDVSEMNYSSTIVSTEDGHNLEQIKLVLDMFEKDTKVLTEPLFTIILILFGVLVSFAGKYLTKIIIIDRSSSSDN